MAGIHIGISGWRYAPWRGDFYPEGLAQKHELHFASRAVGSIEINGSFYALQTPERYADWYADTPEGFVFSVKAPRFITHIKRLREVEKPIANFFASGLFALQEKLGPLLWQFPPSFRFDPPLFEAFLAQLPHDTEAALAIAETCEPRMEGRSLLQIDRKRPLRHAVEIRHESFVDPAFVALLRKYRVALVVADTAGKWPYREDLTGDFLVAFDDLGVNAHVVADVKGQRVFPELLRLNFVKQCLAHNSLNLSSLAAPTNRAAVLACVPAPFRDATSRSRHDAPRAKLPALSFHGIPPAVYNADIPAIRG